MPTGSQPPWQLLRVEAGSVAPVEFAIEHKPAAESFPVENNQTVVFLAKQRVDEQVEPLLKRFDHQLLQQQKLVDAIGFLSPAILVNEALNSIAGTDSRRFLTFKAQTEAFHNSWRQHFSPRILDNHATTMDDLSSLPRWHWAEVPANETNWRIWSRIGLMLALVAGLGAIAVARAARGPIV